MKHLSLEARQAIVEKALGRKGRSLIEIAELHNIGYSTLQKWIKCYRGSDQTNSGNGVRSKTKISQSRSF